MDKSEKDEIKNLIDFGGAAEEPSQTSEDHTDESEPPVDEREPGADVPEPQADETERQSNEPDISIDETKKIVLKNDKTDRADDTADTEATQAIKPVKSHVGETDISDSTEEDIPADDDAEDIPADDDGPEAELTGADLDFDYDFDDGADDEIKPASKVGRIIKYSLISAAAIAFIIIFAVTDTGIIGAYKRNFNHNFHKLFKIPENAAVTESSAVTNDTGNEAAPENNEAQTNTGETVTVAAEETASEFVDMEVKGSAIIPYEYATDSDYSAWSGGIVCAATNYMCLINNKGETEWECTTSVIDPILKTAGKYILIAQEGGTKLCLYEGDKLLYDTDCRDKILAADLSENGDCVLVTTKDLYKGAIAAYNKSGNLIFARSSGTGSVIDAAISPSSRNIAVALLDTDETVRSTVEIFDITENDPIASAYFDDTILFDVEYFGNIVNAFGDNGIAGIKSNGGMIYDMRFDGASLSHYAFDKNGNKLIAMSAANIPTLTAYNVRGRERGMLTTLKLPDFLCIDKGFIMYGTDREIIAGKPNGSVFERYTASMDIRDLIMTDTNTFFIVYSNSLELVKR